MSSPLDEKWHDDQMDARRPALPPRPPAAPDPPTPSFDRHYVQVAFDEPTVQLLSSVLSVHIGQMAQLDEQAVLAPDGQLDLQLSRRARAQLLYAYAQWLQGPA